MSIEYIAFFLVAFLLMLFGVPVAAVMGLSGMLGGYLLYGAPFLASVGNMVWGVQTSEFLTAIPLFIMMGEILLRTGVADKMYEGLAVWTNGIPGRLLHTNIGCCAMFAATTGSSPATAAAVGTVAMKALNERGYPLPISLGSLAAGATLGILIPPSVAMIVYGSLTTNSIGKLFAAGILPGLLLSGLFMAYIFLYSLIKGDVKSETRYTWKDRMASFKDLLPPLLIFGVVMGSIYLGWATPVESASLGVILAIIIAWVLRRINKAVMLTCFVNTAQLSGMILLIVAAAYILNMLLTMVGIANAMTDFVASLNLSLPMFVAAMVVVYLILGMFMDVLSMQVATIPIVYPMAMAVGADPIWFGIFIVIMSELAMITPPVGMNLFVIQAVRNDGGTINQVIAGVLPFCLIMLGMVVLLVMFPELATWLPQHMS
jgi:tripartite ATP-independent transporter DctM subunit